MRQPKGFLTHGQSDQAHGLIAEINEAEPLMSGSEKRFITDSVKQTRRFTAAEHDTIADIHSRIRDIKKGSVEK